MTTARPPASPLPHGLHRAAPDTVELEHALAAVEGAIATLGDALAHPQSGAIEAAAGELQAALRAAMAHFAQAARRGILPPLLRRRFAMAGGQVAAQREALFRATSALDQALDILIPRTPVNTSTYTAQGAGQRGPGQVIAAS